MNQPTAAPTNKVASAGLGGALSVLVIFVIQSIWNVEIPAEVAAAIAAIVSFVAGYMTKEGVA